MEYFCCWDINKKVKFFKFKAFHNLKKHPHKEREK